MYNSEMIKTNYHTHSTFCDGKNTPEEMVLKAIEDNFDILGFSSHSMFPHAASWHIQPKNYESYVAEINRLKEKYKDKIKILCGFEADYIPSFALPSLKRFEQFNPDYIIGATHYLVNEKGFMTVDDSIENVKKGIDELFNGDGKKAAKEYFFLEREMLSKGNFPILAHCDLVRIRNGALNLFSEKDSWYKNELKATAKAIAKSGTIVEINTGAIFRKTMDDVYPSRYFLELLHSLNVPITLSSDSHSVDSLDFAFDRALKIAVDVGYSEVMIIDEEKSYPQKIKL